MFKLFSNNKRSDKKHFLITSAGWAGSIWLAGSLHKLPEVVCSVGVDHPIASLSYYYNNDEILSIIKQIRAEGKVKYGITKDITEHPYYAYLKDMIVSEGALESVEKSPTRDTSKLYSYLFQELDGVNLKPAKKFIGNVHGVTAINYIGEMRKGKDAFGGIGNNITVLDLIRDPISRLDSVINRYSSYYTDAENADSKSIKDSLNDNKELLERLEKQYKIDPLSPLNAVFIWAELISKHSMGWASDIKAAPDIKRITMERLREDEKYFSDVIGLLTGNKIKLDKDYIDFVFSEENLESGRVVSPDKRKKRLSSKEIFQNWPEWQQREISRIFKESELIEFYKQFDYDLSFIK